MVLSKLKWERVYFQAHSGDYWQALENLPGLFTRLPVCLISLLYGLPHRLPECHHGTLSRTASPHGSWLPSERANEGERTYRHGSQCIFFFNLFILFIYFWLCWVFVAGRGLSLVAVSGGYSPLRCTGFSLRWLLLLQSTGSRHVGFSSCGMRAQ